MKKKWNGGRVKDKKEFANVSKIIPVDIGEYNTERVTIYGANMVMARHLPFIIDGLKPVARRTLVSIYRAAKSKPTTMPNAIAETMKIHPHGDSSIYDCIILMAQPWKKMIPMIDSMDENYGSAAGFGDKEADARYLKTRLSDYALDCFFSDYDEKVVEMKPNFDENTTEPLYLPAKYPNLFINGGDGLAWGYSTNVPVYNIIDILEYTIHLIEKPYERFRDIYPDSPTGCDIIDSPEIFRKLQFEGFLDEDIRSHSFIMQSVITKDQEKHTLTVESFPPNRTTELFFKGIDDMREAGVLVGCTKVKNECQGEEIKITLCFKPEINLDEVRESLFGIKLGTRVSFSAQITVVDSKNDSDLFIQRYSVEECLKQWIACRRDFKRRFYHRKIVECKARVHQIEQMLEVFSKDNYDTTIKIIRNSETKEELIHNLIREFDIDTVQANAIANMRQYENVKEIRKKYASESEELSKIIDTLIDLVRNTDKIDDIIVKELKEGIKKYNEPRRSRIITDDEDYEDDTEYKLIVTCKGMIKKLINSFKGIGRLSSEDFPKEIRNKILNRDTVLAFDMGGKVHCIPVRDIKGVDSNHPGFSFNTFAKTNKTDVVKTFIIRDESLLQDGFNSEGFFIFVTKNGNFKKMNYEEILKIKNSCSVIKLKASDSLIDVEYVNDDCDVLLFTADGFGIRFSSDKYNDTRRESSGITLLENKLIAGFTTISKNSEYLLTVTANGFVKKISLKNIDKSNKKEPISVITKLESYDTLAFVLAVSNKDNIAIVTKEKVYTFNVGDDIDLGYKNQKGNRIVQTKISNPIIKVFKN